MLNPSIFISHSAKDKSSKAVLKGLHRVLTKNFDVLLDKERLKPGVEWRPELFAWLKRCESAVILLSLDALKSGWVLQEATILNWRRSYETKFSILPILLAPVKPDDLKKGLFETVALDRLQIIQCNKRNDVVKTVANILNESQVKPEKVSRLASSKGKSADQVAAICYKNERVRTATHP